MEQGRHKPDEMTSFEYLTEHLYQRAQQGEFEMEFEASKTCVSVLKPFSTLQDLIQSVEQTPSIKEQVVLEIKLAWRANYEIRPDIGIVLLLTIWQDMPQTKLEDFYYDLFLGLDKEQGGVLCRK
jgi:hypothetical protein